jgi:hypothetical protein
MRKSASCSWRNPPGPERPRSSAWRGAGGHGAITSCSISSRRIPPHSGRRKDTRASAQLSSIWSPRWRGRSAHRWSGAKPPPHPRRDPCQNARPVYPAHTHHQPTHAMKESASAPAPSIVSDWTRELWAAEAQYTATVGSRLKFGLPLSPAKPKRHKARAGKRAAVRVVSEHGRARSPACHRVLCVSVFRGGKVHPAALTPHPLSRARAAFPAHEAPRAARNRQIPSRPGMLVPALMRRSISARPATSSCVHPACVRGVARRGWPGHRCFRWRMIGTNASLPI